MPEGERFSTRLFLPELGCFQVREGRPPASAFASRFARMLTAVRNHWYYSIVRWRAVKHDHAMQVTWLNLKVGHTPRP
jgi:hypothetical protein